MTKTQFDVIVNQINSLQIIELGTVNIKHIPLWNKGQNAFQYRSIEKMKDTFSIVISQVINNEKRLSGLASFMKPGTQENSVEAIKVPSNWYPIVLVGRTNNEGFICLSPIEYELNRPVLLDELDQKTADEINGLFQERKSAFLKKCEKLVEKSSLDLKQENNTRNNNSWGM